ncbi:hypothetical protein [uncultured Chryseobacterium sp.]|uniref:hypothetical protein n=1 Tax=uncultured Chryseobacterium sp. TaxID=259322 RepID=UPI002589A351|nr:hypothetical protein [uncultured Chryseobacterium sp.]
MEKVFTFKIDNNKRNDAIKLNSQIKSISEFIASRYNLTLLNVKLNTERQLIKFIGFDDVMLESKNDRVQVSFTYSNL